MKVFLIVGFAFLCIIIKSEIISLLFILATVISFLVVVGKENPHDTF
jgi:hypothetical protein